MGYEGGAGAGGSAPREREGRAAGDGDGHDDSLFCPVSAALDLLTGRYTLHVLRALLAGPRRFNEVAQECGVNAHTLRERLRALEGEGVVTRTVVSTMPPNVEYRLTEKGHALNGAFEELAAWGRTWMAPPGDGRAD